MKKLNPTERMRVKRFWKKAGKMYRIIAFTIIIIAFILLSSITIKTILTQEVDRIFPDNELIPVYDEDNGEYAGVLLGLKGRQYPLNNSFIDCQENCFLKWKEE